MMEEKERAEWLKGHETVLTDRTLEKLILIFPDIYALEAHDPGLYYLAFSKKKGAA